MPQALTRHPKTPAVVNITAGLLYRCKPALARCRRDGREGSLPGARTEVKRVMGLFNVLGGRRRRIAIVGGLLGGGAGAALLGTALQHFLQRPRVKQLAERRLTEPVSSDDVESALGEERIKWLMRQTGLTRSELVAGLRFSKEVEADRFARYSLGADRD